MRHLDIKNKLNKIYWLESEHGSHYIKKVKSDLYSRGYEVEEIEQIFDMFYYPLVSNYHFELNVEHFAEKLDELYVTFNRITLEATTTYRNH